MIRKMIKHLSKTMKMNRIEMPDNSGITLPLVLLILLLAGGTVRAQTAPPFSNDLMMDDQTYFFVMTDRLEYSSISGPDPVVWDIQGYIGKEYHKFWYKAEGEALTAEKEGEMEFEALYSRAITAYFDLQAGIRYELLYDGTGNRSRALGVIGLQGLAPYFFEVDGSLMVSEAGDISAGLEAEYDLPITQRFFGQPRLETNIAVQEVEEFGVGSGVNNVRLGFRLRYEIRREFAPYVGVSWNRKLGETADFARLEGEGVSSFGLLGGLRMWF